MLDIKSWNYKKIALSLIYFILALLILNQKDTASRYFTFIKLSEFLALTVMMRIIEAKFKKNHKKY